MKLHIGGEEVKPGWTLMNIQGGPGVDIVGDFVDLSMIASGTVEVVYASHVMEHVGHSEVPRCLAEVFRVLQPGGKFLVSVPDLAILSWALVMPYFSPGEQSSFIGVIFGGQKDKYDFHKTGFTLPILGNYLAVAGFKEIFRVKSFGLFEDFSTYMVHGIPISLNMEATKPV